MEMWQESRMSHTIVERIKQVHQRKAAGRRGCIRRKYQECEDAAEEMTQFVITMTCIINVRMARWRYKKCLDA
jgi:hypothetical protein